MSIIIYPIIREILLTTIRFNLKTDCCFYLKNNTEEPLFLKRREEQTHDVSLTVSHRALAWEGYLPELALNWYRTRSNIPIYDREVRTLRLGLRQLF